MPAKVSGNELKRGE